MEENRELKLLKLESGQETIYHELGHLLGYILANVSEATWLGEVAEFSIGFNRRCVVPKEYLYHKTYKKGGLTDEDLKHNTKNPPRTLAWVCEVLLGCTAQCVFEKKEFPTCYRKAVGWEIVKGNTDYRNVECVNQRSFYEFDDSFLASFQIDIEKFVKNNDVINKLAPFVKRIKDEISQTDDFQKTYRGDDLELLYNSVSEILDDGMKVSYLEMINKFSDELKSLHSSENSP